MCLCKVRRTGCIIRCLLVWQSAQLLHRPLGVPGWRSCPRPQRGAGRAADGGAQGARGSCKQHFAARRGSPPALSRTGLLRRAAWAALAAVLSNAASTFARRHCRRALGKAGAPRATRTAACLCRPADETRCFQSHARARARSFTAEPNPPWLAVPPAAPRSSSGTCRCP